MPLLVCLQGEQNDVGKHQPTAGGDIGNRRYPGSREHVVGGWAGCDFERIARGCWRTPAALGALHCRGYSQLWSGLTATCKGAVRAPGKKVMVG
jgi:hypothetical protein